MIILGINYHHGDSSACIIKDGKVLSAVEEERFIGIKHCSDFPINSILYCLKSNDITTKEVDYIAVNKKRSYNLFQKLFFISKSLTNLLNLKYYYNFFQNKHRDRELELLFSKDEIDNKKIEVSHHLSHAYSTEFFKEQNNKSLIFSFDGSGDFSTIESFLVEDKKIKLIQKRCFPNSLGFFYSAFTQFLGFNEYGDEYKVMSLAGYGKPIYLERVKRMIKSYYPFKLNMKYFNLPLVEYNQSYPIINKIHNAKFKNLFPELNENNDLLEVHKNIASSFQKVFEDVVFENLIELKKKFNINKVFLTGGCAFNSLLIGKIIKKNLFERVVLGPNPGDAGGAIGAAYKVAIDKGQYNFEGHQSAYLGNYYSNEFIEKRLIEKFINKDEFKVKFFENFDELLKYSANKIIEQNLIFWFQDKMEWGPRALGNRSILANPEKKDIKEIINNQIKKREEFRPFAPVILEDKADFYFNMCKHQSNFMNIVFDAKKITYEQYPGVVNVDNTSRVQTVDKKNNNKLFKLITEFNKLTNCPMLINTSLNVKGPIAQSPYDALKYLKQTTVKTLVLNNWVLEKK